ncbi:MAG: phosphatase PAP2 family protein, partial [Bacteroidota bacterium]|nr:phosphatase PAP2 family protein [Bacteroidota bacterium]
MVATLWQYLRHALRAHKMLLLALLAGLVLPWVVFVNVAEDIWESGGFVGDKRILELLHTHAAPGLDKLALGLTAIGDPLPMGLLAGLITVGLAVWGTRAQAWFFGLSVGGAMLLNVLVKAAFARPRPALWLSLKPAFYYSFPSGHAMGAAAVTTALGFLLWRHRSRWPALLLGTAFALG